VRRKIEFAYGEPVTLTLRFPQGREMVSRWYERWHDDTVQFLFSAEEGGFYLSDCAGSLLNARLRSLGVRSGDVVTITKLRVHNPNSARPITEYCPRVCEAA
jgi:hypothetical protein